MKTLYWLVKREFWEHRGGFLLAPIITGSVFLLITLLTVISGEVLGHHMDMFHIDGMSGNWNINNTTDPEALKHFGMALDVTICVAALIILAVMAIVVFFYCLGSLYDDRRDRSILFWQSLPVSNWKTVISKVISATFVAPVIAAVLGVVSGIALIIFAAVVASIHGLNVWSALSTAHPIELLLNLVGLIPLYAICALPTIGWLMLCSAWARSKPFLWAFIIPLASVFIVWWLHLLGVPGLDAKWYFSHIVSRMLFAVGPGNWTSFTAPLGPQDDTNVFDQLSLLHNYSALGSTELWAGTIAGGIMLAAAIWLRRWRDDN